MVSTAPAVAACRRCHGRGRHFLEAGADQWPLEVSCAACAVCADLDAGDGAADDDGDDCRWSDDVGEGCPDDSARFAAVAAHYPADHAA